MRQYGKNTDFLVLVTLCLFVNLLRKIIVSVILSLVFNFAERVTLKGYAMEEKRRNKRTAMNSKLLMKHLGGDDHTEVDIEILDLSKGGVGFKAKEELKMGEVYEAHLRIWTKEVIHAFLQIVRIKETETGYVYGAVFIGLTETDAARIEVYQTINDN